MKIKETIKKMCDGFNSKVTKRTKILLIILVAVVVLTVSGFLFLPHFFSFSASGSEAVVTNQPTFFSDTNQVILNGQLSSPAKHNYSGGFDYIIKSGSSCPGPYVTPPVTSVTGSAPDAKKGTFSSTLKAGQLDQNIYYCVKAYVKYDTLSIVGYVLSTTKISDANWLSFRIIDMPSVTTVSAVSASAPTTLTFTFSGTLNSLSSIASPATVYFSYYTDTGDWGHGKCSAPANETIVQAAVAKPLTAPGPFSSAPYDLSNFIIPPPVIVRDSLGNVSYTIPSPTVLHDCYVAYAQNASGTVRGTPRTFSVPIPPKAKVATMAVEPVVGYSSKIVLRGQLNNGSGNFSFVYYIDPTSDTKHICPNPPRDSKGNPTGTSVPATFVPGSLTAMNGSMYSSEPIDMFSLTWYAPSAWYCYEIIAQNVSGLAEGGFLSFQAPFSTAPKVSSATATRAPKCDKNAINQDMICPSGSVTSTGGAPIIYVGYEYGQSAKAPSSDCPANISLAPPSLYKFGGGILNSDQTMTLTSLPMDTLIGGFNYYYRVYAINAAGIGCGNWADWTTSPK